MVLEKILVDRYLASVKYPKHIVAFPFRNRIWEMRMTAEQLVGFCSQVPSSKDGGMSIRFRPTTAQREVMVSLGAKPIMTEAEFNNLDYGTENLGIKYERYLAERFGVENPPSNTAYWEAPDLEVEGGLQAKFFCATLTNEKKLEAAGF